MWCGACSVVARARAAVVVVEFWPIWHLLPFTQEIPLPQTFQQAFYQVVQQAENQGQALTLNQGKLTVMAEKATPTPLESAALALAETHVRAALGFDPTEPIDWTEGCQVPCSKPGAAAGVGAINWQNILTLIETYLPQILAILLPLLGG